MPLDQILGLNTFSLSKLEELDPTFMESEEETIEDHGHAVAHVHDETCGHTDDGHGHDSDHGHALSGHGHDEHVHSSHMKSSGNKFFSVV